MSIVFCEYCNAYIDTDIEADHFDCADDFICVIEEIDEEPDECENARRYEQDIALSQIARNN